MQRRAAAIYVAFFLIVGAASYSLIATAEAPTIEFQDPAASLGTNDTFSVGDRQYTVTALTATKEGGGHGSAARLVRSGTLAWTNESARYTATWDNNSTVTFDDTERRVVIPNETDPGSFRLREEINRTQILSADPAADNQTVTRNGEKYVVITENGTSQLVPAGEYFPEPESTAYEEGQTVDYRGNETTFANVSADSVTLEWTASQTNEIELADQSNVTLNGEQYLAYFPDNETVLLTQNYDAYREQTQSVDEYHKHVNGLWGISIVSFLVAVLLVGMAYLPSRY
jgi:hypothetical protein